MKDDAFEARNREMIAKMGDDDGLTELSKTWFNKVCEYEYSYHFRWLGLPIIQFPQDIVAMQELIWSVQPDLIIETGIARGGSLIFYASMMHLLGRGKVVGIDIDIRQHNREAIEKHRFFEYCTMLEGSSTAPDIVQQVHDIAAGHERVLVVLDSMHTHQHVLDELRAYAPLVSEGSYCVVFDTVVRHMPEAAFPNRPWNRDDNPWTAVHAYLEESDRFEIDASIHQKLQATVAPDGFLKRVK